MQNKKIKIKKFLHVFKKRNSPCYIFKKLHELYLQFIANSWRTC